MLPRPFALLLAILLIIAGTVRIAWIAGHDPVLGYANQFDMGRTSACFGLWPDLPAPARYEAHREAPIARYVEGEHRPDECYASSELLFTGVAMATWKLLADTGYAAAESMDLRYVGAVKAIALVLLALVFAALLREHPAWLLAHAAVFALVIADPVATLWLNTLYTEFAAVYFAWMAVLCLVVIAGTAPQRSGWYLAFGVALLGLGLSRQQHALLPLCLLLLAWPWVRVQQRRIALPLATLSIAVIVLQIAVIARPPSIGAANNVNVVLGALLPGASDQQAALARLGLPAGCADVIGASWYVTMGEDLGAKCPGVKTLPRLRVAALVAAEPMIAIRALLKAAPLSQPAVLRYVGSDAARPYGALQEQPSWLAASIATTVERLPVAVYLGGLLVVVAAFLACLAAWATAIVRHESPSLVSTLGSALGGIAAYAMLTSVLGDGLVELPRHAHLGIVAMHALALLGLVLCLIRIAGRLARPSTPGAAASARGATWLDWSLLAVAAAVPATSPLWLGAWRQQPLAIGVVDEPESNRLAGPTITLHGWSLAPFGPTTAVTVVNGAVQLASRPWQHPTDPLGAALARTFPTYRDPATARFETVIDTRPFGDAPLSVRTYARSADGVMTEIDRRTLIRRTP